jgi:hypothetical protein
MTQVPKELAGLPYKRIVAEKLSSNFKDTKIIVDRLPETIPNDFAIVKLQYPRDTSKSRNNQLPKKYDAIYWLLHYR